MVFPASGSTSIQSSAGVELQKQVILEVLFSVSFLKAIRLFLASGVTLTH